MDKRAGPVAEISLERGEISLTGMGISPYKHSQAGWPGCWDESSKIPLQAIFNNCQINVKTTKLSRQAGWNFLI
jgi:hypothetical protein